MSLAPGTRLGAYEVLSSIGAGGMGEVYRARDTRLKRDVAIKVLLEAFLHDPDRLARFQREAELLATLNHPNIAAVYGLEQADGVTSIVLELVEGDTLADRIRRGPVPLSDTLLIARQIAEAIEAAHEKGIVHRDLKPANIKITPHGVVKVLDFGLAKAAIGDASAPDLTHSPTITIGGTREGVILGTAAYMSPEQARALPVDKRADIWAFGCVVVYELLAGQRAFGGASTSDALVEVLTRQPDWSALPADVPASIRTLLGRCLQKDPKRRLRDIADARLEIEEPTPRDAFAAPGPSRWRQVAWAAGVLAAAAAGMVAGLWLRPAAVDAPERRVHIAESSDGFDFAMSPDGRALVINRQFQLWLRPLASETSRLLPGTDTASWPFWSPDNRSVGFFTGGQLKRIDVETGAVNSVTSATVSRGGSWGRDGTLLFAIGSGALLRVPAAGGPAVEATRLLPGQTNHRFPRFLPDGRRFLFLALGSPETRGVYTGSLGTTDIRPLAIEAQSTPAFFPPDRLVFARQGALWAQRIDLDLLTLQGDPVPVSRQVLVDRDMVGAASVSSSAAGVLAYRTTPQRDQLFWLDRSGKQVGTVGEPDIAQAYAVSVSPDGRTVALGRQVDGNSDVWLMDTGQAIPHRFTFDAAWEGYPLFSPRGDRIVFGSMRQNGITDLYEKSIAGAGNEAMLVQTPNQKAPDDFSPDGRYLLYNEQDPKTGIDILAQPLFGDRTPFAFVRTPFNEWGSKISPDGHWIAYLSDETGRPEVFASAFPGPGGKVQISTAGGVWPRWRPDGRELFYKTLDSRVMAVPIRATGSRLEPGAPEGLFTLVRDDEYTVAPDGRFLVKKSVADAPPITLIFNWKPPVSVPTR